MICCQQDKLLIQQHSWRFICKVPTTLTKIKQNNCSRSSITCSMLSTHEIKLFSFHSFLVFLSPSLFLMLVFLFLVCLMSLPWVVLYYPFLAFFYPCVFVCNLYVARIYWYFTRLYSYVIGMKSSDVLFTIPGEFIFLQIF